MIGRRKFLAGLTVPFMAPLSATGQTRAKVARIGVLIPSSAAATARFMDAFREGLREHGYVEGQNLILERRYGEASLDRLSEFAAELVRLNVDVIVTATDLAIPPARQRTRTIPIVMASSTDPVGAGFVASLGRPGGNITGLTVIAPELSGKRLELLKQAVPKITRVAFLWTPDVPGAALEYKEIETAARRLRLELQFAEVRRVDEIDKALAALAGERVNALVVAAFNPVLFTNRAQVASFAIQRRLPAMCPVREYVDVGGLMAFGPRIADLWRRAAGYVDKILKGVKPGDLPIEQPSKFELVINMKTAKALGPTIPPSLLLRADQVIE